MSNRLLRKALLGLALALTINLPALANEGGGGGAAHETLKFTTNLGNAAADGHYLQMEIVLEAASPEVSQAIAKFRPRIQHQVILLLSSQTAEVLRTLKGKQDLQEHIKEITNKILDEDDHTGVKEVLFTNFIIQ